MLAYATLGAHALLAGLALRSVGHCEELLGACHKALQPQVAAWAAEFGGPVADGTEMTPSPAARACAFLFFQDPRCRRVLRVHRERDSGHGCHG